MHIVHSRLPGRPSRRRCVTSRDLGEILEALWWRQSLGSAVRLPVPAAVWRQLGEVRLSLTAREPPKHPEATGAA